MSTQTLTVPDIEAGSWTLDKAHTKIGFVAKHLMVSKVRGHFEDFDAKIEIAENLADSTVEVTLDAARITTGAADRDNHVRSADFLDIENHPQLVFKSTGISGEGDKWQLTGDLTIRGETRPVTLDVTYEGTAQDPWGKTHVGFSAWTVIDREEWGLTWNAALEGGGWLVSKDVTIEIEGQLVPV